MFNKCSHNISNKRGFILPYVLLLMVLLLNIFILSIRLYLNEVNYYEKKRNHYQVRVVEERVKRHIVTSINHNTVTNHSSERFYYEHTSVYVFYQYIYTRNEWQINVNIKYKDIYIERNYLYRVDENELTIE